MATFVLFGRYTRRGLQAISAERTEQAEDIVKQNKGKLKAGYALLGEHDLVIITEFPGIEEAMKASVDLARALEIAFTTAPAVTIEDFDKMMT